MPFKSAAGFSLATGEFRGGLARAAGDEEDILAIETSSDCHHRTTDHTGATITYLLSTYLLFVIRQCHTPLGQGGKNRNE